MSGQKKELSKLCLTGFILSILFPISMAFLSMHFHRTMGWILLAIILPLPLVGFILSIVGLVTAKKKNKKGKGFGIVGIVLPSIYAVIAMILILLGAAFLSILKGGVTDKKIPSFYTDSEIVAVRYYHSEQDGSYRIEELDEEMLDEFVDDLNSMELHTGGMIDYYWGGSFGIEMELDDGTYMTYDGTRLERLSRSRLDEDFSYDDKIRGESTYVYIMNEDFWEVMNDYFPSIEENGDHVWAQSA